MAYFQTDNLWVNRLGDGVADLVMDVADSPVNELTAAVLADIGLALDRVENDATFRLLLVRTSKGANFASGLSPQTLAKLTSEQFVEIVSAGQALCRRLAQLRMPAVAMVSGACLGAGLELALACDYRIAIDKPTTKFGFPDAELGLMPTWGATQRLPLVIGIERGLQMLLGARRRSARTAKAWGLIDAVIDEGSQAPPAFLHDPGKRAPQKLPLRTMRQKLSEGTRLGRWLIFRGAERLLRSRLPDDMPAPWEALAAVRAGLAQGVEAGLAHERAAAARLFDSEACRNLVRLHVARDRFRIRSTEQPNGSQVIGVIGDGERALALMHMAVSKGFQVIVRATDEGALGLTLVRLLTLFRDDAASGALAAADFTRKLANVKGTTAWNGFENASVVLEATEADPDRVAALFEEVETATSADTLLVTTGIAPSVSELQDASGRPEMIAGLSFLAPVKRSLLVEVVASEDTDVETAKRLSDIVARLGRTPWPVKDEPGFLVERLLIPYLHEAMTLVKEGMALARVDEAMTHFGMAHGPFEYADLVGIDAAAALTETLAPTLEPRLHLGDALAFMVRTRWLGQKAGVGFYRHRGKRKKVNRALIAHLRTDAAAAHQLEPLSHADQLLWAQKRLVMLTINEAAWCLEEGRAASAEALDLALTLAGWAPHRGGPLHYARHLGRDKVIRDLEDLAGRFGPRYQPCPRLKDLLAPPPNAD